MEEKPRFRTVKQVKAALYRNRHLISNGSCAVLCAEQADGGFGRLYKLHIRAYGPLTPRHFMVHGHNWSFINAFEVFSNWVQGGLDKKELLAWANENLD
jgi:hypothetical protein